MRSVLEAKPADRFAHIDAVLGLGELERFEQQAKDALKDLKDRKSTVESGARSALDLL